MYNIVSVQRYVSLKAPVQALLYVRVLNHRAAVRFRPCVRDYFLPSTRCCRAHHHISRLSYYY